MDTAHAKAGWIVDESELAIRTDGALGTVFTVGNGFFCTRGSVSEKRFDTHRSTYVAGVFAVAPHGLHYLMGAPDWTPAWVEIDGARAQVTSSRRVLNMQEGLLTRTARCTASGTEVELVEQRFASFATPFPGCQRVVVRRISGSGSISVALGVDSEVRSTPSKYYHGQTLRALDATGVKTTVLEKISAAGGMLDIVLRSPVDGRRTRAAAIVSADGNAAPHYSLDNGFAIARWQMSPGATESAYVKLAVIGGDVPGYRDAIADTGHNLGELAGATWNSALERHREKMRAYWNRADVVIEGDLGSQLSVRHALWSTRIASPLDNGLSSIGARNLNGDLYRGGVFWDVDGWQFPMLLAAEPERAANHIRYRYRNLGLARKIARQDGFDGATYVAALYGVELEGSRKDGFGYHEIHMNGAVCWAIDHYFQATRDTGLLLECGLGLFLEIAKYWASRAELDPADQRYHIRYVVGPDEFKRSGVDDNAYTNIMAAYTLRRARRLWEIAHAADQPACLALTERLGIDPECFTHWEEIAEKLHLPFIEERDLIEQYVGYRDKPEPDTRLNKGQWGFVDKTSKQADTLLLWQLDVPCRWQQDRAMIERCWREYAPICHHLSSLSYCTHAIVAARLGHDRDAEEFYRLTQDIDLRSESSESGGHGAGEGGVWLATIWGMGGYVTRGERVHVDPLLPPRWIRLRYSVLVDGCIAEVDVTQNQVTVVNRGRAPLSIGVAGALHTIAPQQCVAAPITRSWNRQQPEAVLIEMDPLITDLSALDLEVWKELARVAGLPHPERAARAASGLSGTAAVEAALTAVAADTSDQRYVGDLATIVERLYISITGTKRGIVTPARRIAEKLARIADGKRQLATIAPIPSSAALLAACGLDRLVDMPVDSSVAQSSPPDPDMLIVACRRMRVLPWNVVAVGSTDRFISAARALNMRAERVSDLGELNLEALEHAGSCAG